MAHGGGDELRRRLVVLFLLGCTACAQARPSPAFGVGGDAWISAEIHRRLQQEKHLPSGGEIQVQTAQGVVVLSGRVGSSDEVRRALRIASHVRGVRQVVNRLHVLPSREPALQRKTQRIPGTVCVPRHPAPPAVPIVVPLQDTRTPATA